MTTFVRNGFLVVLLVAGSFFAAGCTSNGNNTTQTQPANQTSLPPSNQAPGQRMNQAPSSQRENSLAKVAIILGIDQTKL